MISTKWHTDISTHHTLFSVSCEHDVRYLFRIDLFHYYNLEKLLCLTRVFLVLRLTLIVKHSVLNTFFFSLWTEAKLVHVSVFLWQCGWSLAKAVWGSAHSRVSGRTFIQCSCHGAEAGWSWNDPSSIIIRRQWCGALHWYTYDTFSTKFEYIPLYCSLGV